MGAESPLGLLRRPVVQLLLGAVAVAQVVGVGFGSDVARAPELAVLTPARAAAPGGGSVAEAWEARALERESERLATEYRSKGYPVSGTLARQIHAAAVDNGIDPEIAFGLVRAESSFRNQATSPVGAVGLTQLMPRTASWMEPGITRAQLRDPETNLRVGFKYLSYLLEKYDGNENLALLAYNRGPGTVDRAIKQGRSPDNGYAAFVRGQEGHGHRLFTR